MAIVPDPKEVQGLVDEEIKPLSYAPVDAFCDQEGFGLKFKEIKTLVYKDEMHGTTMYVNKRRAKPLMDSKGEFFKDSEAVKSFMGGCLEGGCTPLPDILNPDGPDSDGPFGLAAEKKEPNVYLAVEGGKKDVYVTLRGELHIAKLRVDGTEAIVENGRAAKEIKFSQKGDEEIFNVRFVDEEIKPFGGFRYDRCCACGDPTQYCRPPCERMDCE